MTTLPIAESPGGGFVRRSESGPPRHNDTFTRVLRILAGTSVAALFLFLLNSYLTFWLGWPGVPDFLADRQWLGPGTAGESPEGAVVIQGWIQFLLYPLAVSAVAGYVARTPDVSLRAESARLTALSMFIVRAAFWGVLLIGIADWTISAVRVEGLLDDLVGAHLADALGRSAFRGAYVHYPLLALSVLIAFFTRTLGFPWLALLIVLAELQIVLSRFVFSYEQTYMSDLVRFWYAALFLFASAYTLPQEGHVRVDVFYAGLTKQRKALTNAVGSAVLGLPLCWVILVTGMGGKTSSLASPLLIYEINPTGFGMYIKYLMAGFLIVYAVSMAIQFTSYFLAAVADLRRDAGGPQDDGQEATEL